MKDRLAPFYQASSDEAARRKETEPLERLERIISAMEPGSGLVSAISGNQDVSVIAEHKRKSPSEGDIRPDSSIARIAEQHQLGGAAALSVLTQEKNFGGALEDMAEARSASTLPVLRKDFISDEYQLYQAKAYGAEAVLLIAGGLSVSQLCNLQEEASDIGLDCLVEIHDEQDLEIAMECLPDMIGINNRNLATLEVDLDTTHQLIGHIPGDVPVVAESGYKVTHREHFAELRKLKVDGVLVGTDLMIQDNPAQALSDWLSTDSSS
jgi:indole-3-glycerol phosphate synthase